MYLRKIAFEKDDIQSHDSFTLKNSLRQPEFIFQTPSVCVIPSYSKSDLILNDVKRGFFS